MQAVANRMKNHPSCTKSFLKKPGTNRQASPRISLPASDRLRFLSRGANRRAVSPSAPDSRMSLHARSRHNVCRAAMPERAPRACAPRSPMQLLAARVSKTETYNERRLEWIPILIKSHDGLEASLRLWCINFGPLLVLRTLNSKKIFLQNKNLIGFADTLRRR